MSYNYPNADLAESDGIWSLSVSATYRYELINTYPGTDDYIYASFNVPTSFYTGLENIPSLPTSGTLRIYLSQSMADVAVLKDYYLIDGASTVIASGENVNLSISDSPAALEIPLTINSVTVVGSSTKLQLNFGTGSSIDINIYGIQVEWASSSPPPATTNAGAFLALMANWPN